MLQQNLVRTLYQMKQIKSDTGDVDPSGTKPDMNNVSVEEDQVTIEIIFSSLLHLSRQDNFVATLNL